MLYELVEGRRTFTSEDLIELLQQVAEKSPPAPRTPHRELAAIMMKCLGGSRPHRPPRQLLRLSWPCVGKLAAR